MPATHAYGRAGRDVVRGPRIGASDCVCEPRAVLSAPRCCVMKVEMERVMVLEILL